MSKLEELIQQYCPDGVETRKIGNCCRIETGKLNANAAEENGKYMFFTTAKEPSRINSYRWDTEALLVAGNANIGEVKHYIGKFEAYQRTYVLTNFSKDINVRYLYYVLSNNLKQYLDNHKNEAAMTYIVLSTLQEFEVPVPALPVQREIVQILDKFSLLSAELAAELAARKRQYEYYRDELLTFKTEVEEKELQEVLKIKNGKDYKQFNEGEYPVYGTGGIMAYIDNYAYDKPSVLIPRKGSLDKMYYLETPFWTVDTIFYTEIDEKQVVPKYVYYFLQMKHLEDLNEAGGVPSLTQNTLNKVKISVPSIDIQKRIVHVLDNFDAICSDLNIGLPAEIEARQKQYEYYRNMLLSFETPFSLSLSLSVKK